MDQNQINFKLHEFLFDYRNTQHCSTGETPTKLMFGRNVRTRFDVFNPITKAQTERDVDKAAKIKMAVSQQRQIRNAKGGRKPIKLNR